MGRKLSDEEIKRRLIEGRNSKKLHAQAQISLAKLRAENKFLKAELVRINTENQATINKLSLEIAQLQQMVFGKKKRVKQAYDRIKPVSKKSPLKRSSDSYRRPLPDQSEITETQKLDLDEKCSCGGNLIQTSEEVRYLEDIPLPEMTKDYQARLVTKQIIAKGVCRVCKQKVVAANYDLGGQKVRLGNNLKLLVVDLVSRVGLSYAKTSNLVETLYGLKVSTGEIANIIEQIHQRWLPSYVELQDEVRASPSLHIDETSWSIQALNNYGQAWVMSSEDSQQTVFALKDSRGVAHLKKLLKGFKGVRITDNYGAYSNKDLKGDHQLCWAHLYRYIADLKANAKLLKYQRVYVTWWYESFWQIYEKLTDYLEQAKPKLERLKQIKELEAELVRLINNHPPKAGEPEKLTKFRAQLHRALIRNKLFTCLRHLTPADNNRAERDLRPLVIKRKISFGSKTQKGANALATVMSLCISTYRKHPNNYFKALAALG